MSASSLFCILCFLQNGKRHGRQFDSSSSTYQQFQTIRNHELTTSELGENQLPSGARITPDFCQQTRNEELAFLFTEEGGLRLGSRTDPSYCQMQQ